MTDHRTPATHQRAPATHQHTRTTDQRTLAAVTGALYLVTFATSIPALALKAPFLGGGGSLAAAQTAAVLEIMLAVACAGTAVAFYPIGRRYAPALALGFVASRITEAALVAVGVIALLAFTTVRAGLDADAPLPSTLDALAALHDGAFLVGPGLLPALNAALFGTLLIRHRLVPRIIPAAGLIGAPLLTFSALATIGGLVDQVSPVAGVLALPIALWEFAIGIWLLAKGVHVAPVDG
ncbi:MAG: DUF4386 domain-containing protein [Propioniciclava sp.]|uniref:DUF4386 domain-containing protein n=1 Tax=Propioniciclava sp. TaxID=2038686 RepID=UPI0039E41BB1